MQRIKVPRPEDAQGLRHVRTEAAALAQEMEMLNAGSQEFLEKLTKLAELQTALAPAAHSVEAQAEAYARLASASQQAADSVGVAAQAQTASAEARLANDARLAEAHLAMQQTTGEAVVQASLANAQRQMAALDELAQRQTAQADHERALNHTRLDLSRAAQQAFQDMNAAFGRGNQDFAGAQRALFAFSKALAVRDVIVATQREIATVGATYAAAPPVAAALTAKAIASGALRVATIVGQALPQLAGGGVLHGPRHAQGGIRLLDRRTGTPLAEAEGGEVVLTRRVSQHPLLLDLASRINQLAGGVRLNPATAPRQMAAGGVVPAAQTAQTTAAVGADVIRALEALAQRPVVVSVAEINAVQNRVQVLESATAL